MRKILLFSLFLILGMSCKAQVIRQGNVFKEDTTKILKLDTKTQFQYEDSKGVKYPIFISKSGAVYVVKVSKKTGKEYKYYLSKDIKETINKEVKKD